MPRRNWKNFRPSCLSSAMEGCLNFAREKHNRSVEQVSDLMGAKKWTVYKWIENRKIPAHMIRPFEHATGATFVSQYLALSAGYLTIPIPRGKRPTSDDTIELQAVCNAACTEIINFAKDKGNTKPEDVVAAIVPALEQLAWHKAEAERYTQPELEI